MSLASNIINFLASLDYDSQKSGEAPELPIEELNHVILIGNQFFYIGDLSKGEIAYISPKTETILGYPLKDITLSKMYEIIHPDDKIIINKATEKTLQFAFQIPSEPFEYVFNMSYRIQKADGQYIRIMRQSCMYKKDLANKMIYSIAIYTDISHLSKMNHYHFSYTGPDLKIFDYPDQELIQMTHLGILTQMEHKILGLLKQGKTSKEISVILNISSHTVDTHRRNMLQKTNTKNMYDLILFAEEKGLIF